MPVWKNFVLTRSLSVPACPLHEALSVLVDRTDNNVVAVQVNPCD